MRKDIVGNSSLLGQCSILQDGRKHKYLLRADMTEDETKA